MILKRVSGVFAGSRPRERAPRGAAGIGLCFEMVAPRSARSRIPRPVSDFRDAHAAWRVATRGALVIPGPRVAMPSTRAEFRFINFVTNASAAVASVPLHKRDVPAWTAMVFTHRKQKVEFNRLKSVSFDPFG